MWKLSTQLVNLSRAGCLRIRGSQVQADPVFPPLTGLYAVANCTVGPKSKSAPYSGIHIVRALDKFESLSVRVYTRRRIRIQTGACRDVMFLYLPQRSAVHYSESKSESSYYIYIDRVLHYSHYTAGSKVRNVASKLNYSTVATGLQSNIMNQTPGPASPSRISLYISES